MGCWPFRPGNPKACYAFSIPGLVMIIGGAGAAILGLIGGFRSNDFFGYVGGISMVFGIMFILLWYMYTLPLKPDHQKQMPPHYQPPKRGKKKAVPEEKKDENTVEKQPDNTQFVPLDDARKSSIGAAVNNTTYDNVAYEKELPQVIKTPDDQDTGIDNEIKSRSSNSKNSVAPETSVPSTSYSNPVYQGDDEDEQRTKDLETIKNNFTAATETYQPVM